MKPSVIFSAGGTVQASGGVYITRPADEELFRLCMEGAYAYVLTSRQMGKSSLRFAVSERLRRGGIHVSSIDLTTVGTHPHRTQQWRGGLLEKGPEGLRTHQGGPRGEPHPPLTPNKQF